MLQQAAGMGQLGGPATSSNLWQRMGGGGAGGFQGGLQGGLPQGNSGMGGMQGSTSMQGSVGGMQGSTGTQTGGQGMHAMFPQGGPYAGSQYGSGAAGGGGVAGGGAGANGGQGFLSERESILAAMAAGGNPGSGPGGYGGGLDTHQLEMNLYGAAAGRRPSLGQQLPATTPPSLQNILTNAGMGPPQHSFQQQQFQQQHFQQQQQQQQFQPPQQLHFTHQQQQQQQQPLFNHPSSGLQQGWMNQNATGSPMYNPTDQGPPWNKNPGFSHDTAASMPIDHSYAGLAQEQAVQAQLQQIPGWQSAQQQHNQNQYTNAYHGDPPELRNSGFSSSGNISPMSHQRTSLGHTAVLLAQQQQLQQGGGFPSSFGADGQINLIIPNPILTDKNRHKPRDMKKRAQTFPEKLMLAMSEYAKEDAVAWLPDGKSFVVVSPDIFCDTVLARAFKETKYASFVRKLHRWNFVRLTSGTGTDCFCHPLFQRSRKDMVAKMACSPRDKNGFCKSAIGRDEKPPSLAGVEKFIRAKIAAATATASTKPPTVPLVSALALNMTMGTATKDPPVPVKVPDEDAIEDCVGEAQVTPGTPPVAPRPKIV